MADLEGILEHTKLQRYLVAEVTDLDPLLSEFSLPASEAAAVLRSLSNEARLLVLCHLCESSELSAGELNRRVGLSQSAMSQHLARLREDGLVTTRKEAQTVFYRVADAKVRRVLSMLHELYCPELGKSTARIPSADKGTTGQ